MLRSLHALPVEATNGPPGDDFLTATRLAGLVVPDQTRAVLPALTFALDALAIALLHCREDEAEKTAGLFRRGWA